LTLGGGSFEHVLPDEGVDEETHRHPRGADHEGGTTAAFLHDVESAEGADYVYGAEDDLGDVGVGEADAGEDCCSVAVREVSGGWICKLRGGGTY
jgi:hypothetical protein